MSFGRRSVEKMEMKLGPKGRSRPQAVKGMDYFPNVVDV